MYNLTIALPTGRLGKELLSILQTRGIASSITLDSRKLEVIDQENNYRFMFVKPSDVLTYVVNGVADIGVVGKDSILEEEKDVYEVYDLKIGACQFVVAGFEGTNIFGKEEPLIVATKYPNVAKKYFASKNQEIEVIKLNGSVEIAPLVNLSDVIVDITQTGQTLEANGLSILEELDEVTARVVSNRVSYRFKSNIIEDLINQLKE